MGDARRVTEERRRSPEIYTRVDCHGHATEQSYVTYLVFVPLTTYRVSEDNVPSFSLVFMLMGAHIKPSALALLQSGTHCHLTVTRLGSPAHSNEAC